MSETGLTSNDIPGGHKIREGLGAAARPLAALLAAGLAMVIFEKPPGSVVALVYFLPLAVLGFDQQAKGWTRYLMLMFGLAALAVLAVLIEPSFLNMVTAFCFVTAFALSQRGIGPGDALGFLRHGTLGTVASPVYLLMDAGAARPRLALLRPLFSIGNVLVPVVAVGLFGLLLTSANPLLEHWLLSLDQQLAHWLGAPLAHLFTPQVLLVFPLTLALAWSVLRRHGAILRKDHAVAPSTWHAVFFRPSTIAVTLVLLNGMFLVENLLDFNHIWLAAALPPGMTHAAYVHRGSYTLIATVILAAFFIMVALKPGTATHDSPLVRRLVYGFAAQNFFLVMSSAKRTLSYIDAFGMSEWRMAGLIWMALVAFGLGLTVWRIAKRRDNRWLINQNLAASALVMLACGLLDFRPFIARWNVDQAIATNSLTSFDAEYNGHCLGITAVPELERLRQHFSAYGLARPSDAAPLAQIARIEDALRYELNLTQSDWRSWTLRYAAYDQGYPALSWDGSTCRLAD